MPMTPFVDKFPEVGARETRTVQVRGQQQLPAGDYGFLELYCNEPKCDCRRVTILVLRPETAWSKVWATISYGWEDQEFYRAWGGDPNLPEEMTGTYLDPVAIQTKYAPDLLAMFEVLLESPEYVERIKRHYQMFRESVDKEHHEKKLVAVNQLANKRKRLRDPRRRGRGSTER